MKSYVIESENVLKYVESESKPTSENKVTVRVTSAGLTSTDVAIFKGVRKLDLPVIPCSLAVGVVSEVGSEVYSCEKGDKVILHPYYACGRCFSCKTGEEDSCQNFSSCGVNRNGFLCDFLEVPENKLIVIPKHVGDEVAIFARIVDIAIQICDKLDVEKGDNVIIGSAGILGIIIAQVVEYYQATPILIDQNIKNIEMSENFGFAQVYSTNKEDLVQSVMQGTGGQMADSLILLTQHSFTSEMAPKFVKKSGKIAIYRKGDRGAMMDISELFDRNISLLPVKPHGEEFMMAINLLLNGSVKVDGLYKKNGTFSEVEKVFATLSDRFDKKESILVNIVDMLG